MHLRQLFCIQFLNCGVIRWPLVGDRGQIPNQRLHAAYDGRRAYYSNCEGEATKLTFATVAPPGPGIACLGSSAWQGQVVVCIVLQDRHVDRRIQGHERVVRQVDLLAADGIAEQAIKEESSAS